VGVESPLQVIQSLGHDLSLAFVFGQPGRGIQENLLERSAWRPANRLLHL
jgi:hypothetical protein